MNGPDSSSATSLNRHKSTDQLQDEEWPEHARVALTLDFHPFYMKTVDSWGRVGGTGSL